MALTVRPVARLAVVFAVGLGALLGSGCATTMEQRVEHYRQTQNPAGALAYLEQEVALDPSDAEAWYYLGDAYIKSGDLRRGDAALRRASDLSAQYAERAQRLRAYAIGTEISAGRERMRGSDPEAALDHYRQALVLDTVNVALWRAYGDALWQTQDPEQAALAYQRALIFHDRLGPEGDATRGLLLHNLAVTALERGAYPDALRFAEALRAIPPAAGYRDRVPIIQFYAHHGLGDLDEVERAYDRIERDDRTERMRYDRGYLALTIGQPERAVRDLELLAERREATPRIKRLLAETYYALTRYDEMLSLYETLYVDAPRDPQVVRGLVLAHDALGNADEAARYRDALAALSASRTSSDSDQDSRDDSP